jgi:hypothetical protein
VKILATLLVIAAFGGLLAWTTLRGADETCEVCVEWGGRRHCSTVSARTREDAQQRAQLAACGVLGGGMSDELQCQRSQPASHRCEAP